MCLHTVLVSGGAAVYFQRHCVPDVELGAYPVVEILSEYRSTC